MNRDLNFHPCTEDEFKCASGQCIPANFVCDDTFHCLDGSDEGDNCSKSVRFYSRNFKCLNKMFCYFL